MTRSVRRHCRLLLKPIISTVKERGHDHCVEQRLHITFPHYPNQRHAIVHGDHQIHQEDASKPCPTISPIVSTVTLQKGSLEYVVEVPIHPSGPELRRPRARVERCVRWGCRHARENTGIYRSVTGVRGRKTLGAPFRRKQNKTRQTRKLTASSAPSVLLLWGPA